MIRDKEKEIHLKNKKMSLKTSATILRKALI